ncbi:MAG: hypothetical protein AAF826_09025 [Pseudomonadota bacterium]
MKIVYAACLTLALSTPAWAEEPKQGFSLWDLFDEMEMMAEDAMPLMESWMERLQPQLQALGSTIGDLSMYEAPEVLPNGDIIIRRKLGPPKEGEIDL